MVRDHHPADPRAQRQRGRDRQDVRVDRQGTRRGRAAAFLRLSSGLQDDRHPRHVARDSGAGAQYRQGCRLAVCLYRQRAQPRRGYHELPVMQQHPDRARLVRDRTIPPYARRPLPGLPCQDRRTFRKIQQGIRGATHPCDDERNNMSTVHIPADNVELDGELILPPSAKGVVLFAHGSGSSRFSPRNTYVAEVLQQRGIGTLLFDLLTREEDQTYETRFDIALLTQRLLAATAWLQSNPKTQALSLGYFGASTGAAAALQAAAKMGDKIAAVVSRGGRPDLAGAAALGRVTAPTLLIVGGADYVVIELNQQADALMNCEKKLMLIPGATHLFEEPGTLQQAARSAADWFAQHL